MGSDGYEIVSSDLVYQAFGLAGSVDLSRSTRQGYRARPVWDRSTYELIEAAK